MFYSSDKDQALCSQKHNTLAHVTETNKNKNKDKYQPPPLLVDRPLKNYFPAASVFMVLYYITQKYFRTKGAISVI